MYINWIQVQGKGGIAQFWEGDNSPGDVVTLGINTRYRLLEVYEQKESDTGPDTRMWLAAPAPAGDLNPGRVPVARHCVLCGALAESNSVRCQCHDGCTDVNLLAYLCAACLDSDTDQVSLVCEHVRQVNLGS